MDKSEEYFRMCREAKEIQEKWKPEKGDIFLIRIGESGEVRYGGDCIFIESEKVFFEYDHYDGAGLVAPISTSTWLPRQDHLQSMIRPHIEKNFGEDISYLHREFTEWLQKNNPNYDTYEKLWLAFIMDRLYTKIWDGKEWVEVK